MSKDKTFEKFKLVPFNQTRYPKISSSKTDKTFEKFKLVPFNETLTANITSPKTVTTVKPKALDKVKKYLRDYDPTLRAKTNAFVGMRQALYGRKPSWTARKRLDVLNGNMARYKHLSNTIPLHENEQAQPENPKVGLDNDYKHVKSLHEELEDVKEPGD